MGNNPIQSAVRTDKPFYKPGDSVTGSILVNAPKQYPCSKIVLYITGEQSSWWKGQPTKNINNQNKTGQCRGKNKLIDTTYVIYQWNDKNILKGQYNFPFIFSLPSHFPGSFSQTKSNYTGQIKYLIKATCFSSKGNFQCQQQLIIREQQKAATQTLYGQTFAYPKTFYCCNKGVSKICCYFDKNFYIQGQQAVVVCQVDNYRCSASLDSVTCRLIKKITLRSHYNEIKQIRSVVGEINFPGIAKGDLYIGQDAKRQNISLRYEKGENIHPSTSGRCVICEYYIQVIPNFSGCFISGVQSFSVKVIILQEGIGLQQLPVPEQGWKPQQYRRSQIILNYGEQNELLESMQQSMNSQKQAMNNYMKNVNDNR